MKDQRFAGDYWRMAGRKLDFSIFTVINFIFRHNIRYMYWFRKRKLSNGILARYGCYRLSRKYGLEFSPNASIGKGLYIGHPYNITIGDGVVIGDNVNIHKGATLGVESRGKREGAPTIGNRVFIGINATVIGKITIGDDVMIAPGAFVNFDVPSNSVVLGNPGKAYHKDNAAESYICNCVE